jgi:hypothetical protein
VPSQSLKCFFLQSTAELIKNRLKSLRRKRKMESRGKIEIMLIFKTSNGVDNWESGVCEENFD